jgi:hypothetical protein
VTGSRRAARAPVAGVAGAACVALAACIAYVPQPPGDTEPRQLVRVRFSTPREVAVRARGAVSAFVAERVDGRVVAVYGDTLELVASELSLHDGRLVSPSPEPRVRVVRDAATLVEERRTERMWTVFALAALAAAALVLIQVLRGNAGAL